MAGFFSPLHDANVPESVYISVGVGGDLFCLRPAKWDEGMSRY